MRRSGDIGLGVIWGLRETIKRYWTFLSCVANPKTTGRAGSPDPAANGPCRVAHSKFAINSQTVVGDGVLDVPLTGVKSTEHTFPDTNIAKFVGADACHRPAGGRKNAWASAPWPPDELCDKSYYGIHGNVSEWSLRPQTRFGGQPDRRSGS